MKDTAENRAQLIRIEARLRKIEEEFKQIVDEMVEQGYRPEDYELLTLILEK